MLLDLFGLLFNRHVGGDSAVAHPGASVADKRRRDDALTQTIEAAYRRIMGIEPAPEVVGVVAAEVRREQSPDYSGIAEWLQAQQVIVAQIIARQAEQDDEETLLFLM